METSKSRSVVASRSSTELTEKLEGRLRAARRAQAQRSWRIQVPCLLTGLCFIVVGVALQYLRGYGAVPMQAGVFVYMCIGLSLQCILLALLPTHQRLLLLVTALLVLTGLVMTAERFLQAVRCLRDPVNSPGPLQRAEPPPPLWYIQVLNAESMVFCASLLVMTFGWLRMFWVRPPPRLHLDTLWKVRGRGMLRAAFLLLLEVIFAAAAGFVDAEACLMKLAEAAVFALLGCLALWPSLRLRVQTLLAERGGKATTAVAVGALVAKRPLEKWLPVARERFRCVPLDRVSKSMLAENRPNPELAGYTELATLGEVDAFVSHSWMDDADAKWEALQAWRADFKHAMRREPRVWLDKFCIDQDNIEDSLAGLPIYLAGCDKLLVLLGETYQTRLWCLLEIFTFIVMGGCHQNLVIERLSTCKADFESFDARSATCTKEEDCSHLLAVIETGLGTVDHFNQAVSSMVRRQISCLSPKRSQPVAPLRPCAVPDEGARESELGGKPPLEEEEEEDEEEGDDMFSI